MSLVDAFERAVTTLLQQEVPLTDEPSRVLALGLGLRDLWCRTVLAIGGPIAPADHERLLDAGCGLQVVDSLAGGLRKMSALRYDAVAVHPHVDREKGGIQFVRALKRGPRHLMDDLALELAEQFELVPCVILPVEGKSQFVVTVDGTWYAGEDARTPLTTALDGARTLLERVKPRPRLPH